MSKVGGKRVTRGIKVLLEFVDGFMGQDSISIYCTLHGIPISMDIAKLLSLAFYHQFSAAWMKNQARGTECIALRSPDFSDGKGLV